MRETYSEGTRVTIRTKGIRHGSDIYWQYRIYRFNALF